MHAQELNTRQEVIFNRFKPDNRDDDAMDIDSDCDVVTDTPPVEMADAPLSISAAAREVPPCETSTKGELESGLKSRRQLLGHAVGSSEVGSSLIQRMSLV